MRLFSWGVPWLSCTPKFSRELTNAIACNYRVEHAWKGSQIAASVWYVLLFLHHISLMGFPTFLWVIEYSLLASEKHQPWWKNHLICYGRSCPAESHSSLTARVGACTTTRAAGGPVNAWALRGKVCAWVIPEDCWEFPCRVQKWKGLHAFVCEHVYFSKCLQIIFVEA